MSQIDEIKSLIVEIDLKTFPTCDLFHEPEFTEIQTAYAISIPFGHNGHYDSDMILALCERCFSRLQDNDWMLIYCYECNQSRWINKLLSKLRYREDTQIIWTRGCHECPDFDGKPKATYFTNQVQKEFEDGKS